MGAPLGLHYPQAARVRPSGMYPSCIYLRAMFSTHRACYFVPVHGTFFSLMSESCTLKGGCLSIATQGSYRLSGPHPLVLSMASRPGKPATAETSPRAGTRGHRVLSSNPACALKGGCLSIVTQGSYRLSGPHPLVLSMASRPGMPATAETSPRAGTRGRRAPASGQICRNTLKDKAQSQAQPALR